MIFILLLGMYFPSLMASWAIIGLIHGISITSFYSLFTLKEYKNNKSELFSGLLFTENAFRLVVLSVLLILILLVDIFLNKYLLHVLVMFMLYTCNITYNMYKSFGKKNILLHRADELFKDVKILRDSISAIENEKCTELDEYMGEILEKFWDSLDRYKYKVDLDSNGRIKFTPVNSSNNNENTTNTDKHEMNFAQYNFEKLKKGIFNFKIEISEY